MEDYYTKVNGKDLYLVNDNGMIVDLAMLKQDLLEETKRDLIENREDISIIESDLKLLDKIHDNNYGCRESFILEELGAFGYEITSLKDIYYGLNDLKHFWNYNGSNDINNELANKTTDLMKEIENYFRKY